MDHTAAGDHGAVTMVLDHGTVDLITSTLKHTPALRTRLTPASLEAVGVPPMAPAVDARPRSRAASVAAASKQSGGPRKSSTAILSQIFSGKIVPAPGAGSAAEAEAEADRDDAGHDVPTMFAAQTPMMGIACLPLVFLCFIACFQ